MNENKLANPGVPIDELLARRWSPRAFDAARPVSREQLLTLLEAARWAPSCYGDEPWHYLVWNRATDPEGWQKAFACLAESNKPWVANVPVLLLSVAGSAFRHNGKASRWGPHDTGAASMALVLQATALGLAAHQMGGYDSDEARAAFGIPAGYTPMAMIAVGYQAEPETLRALGGNYYDREVGSRSRRPLGSNFFAGAWGEAILA